MNKTENVKYFFVCEEQKEKIWWKFELGYDDGISDKIMHVRMRQGLFFALSDVIDAFVVPGKHKSRKVEIKEQKTHWAHVLYRTSAWPPLLLLAALLRTAHSNNFTLDNVLPWVLSNTAAKCEVNGMNGCRDNRRTDKQRLLSF